MIMKPRNLFWFFCVLLLPAAGWARTLSVVTTTEDLAAISREIGGSHVDVIPIVRGYQDPHFVDAKPSYLLKLKRADLLAIVGLELEVGWLPSLLTNARNPKILPGSPGFLDASQGCRILQKPSGAIDRSMGDIHPEGNPHYWLDPENGRVIARRFAAKLSELDAEHAKDYADALQAFEAKLSDKEKQWSADAAAFKGTKVVTYHNSLPNFTAAFGLDVVDHVEPKPGVPPSPGHVQRLTTRISSEKIPLILVEPYFDEKLPNKIATQTGAKLVIFPPSVGGEPAIKTYFDLFDHDLKLIADALRAHKEGT
jgi:zinc/manganese transport system substrate-binding protein